MSQFATTRWSLILDARGGPASARPALEEICRAYRTPVLTYVRCSGRSHSDAEDLTQEFFARLLERRWDRDADPARGRFRTFLLTALQRFLIDQYQAANAQKRGGGTQGLTLDDVDDTLSSPPSMSPEAVFERAWAATVIERAFARLRDEAALAGKAALFERLSGFLVEPPEAADYRRLAESSGLRANTIAVSVHRMRARLRELVRSEIADQTDSPEAAATELKALHRALLAQTGNPERQ